MNRYDWDQIKAARNARYAGRLEITYRLWWPIRSLKVEIIR